ncbi:hypothetical protein VTN96DRAFT_4462 [Rasamsonia emersonii]
MRATSPDLAPLGANEISPGTFAAVPPTLANSEPVTPYSVVLEISLTQLSSTEAAADAILRTLSTLPACLTRLTGQALCHSLAYSPNSVHADRTNPIQPADNRHGLTAVNQDDPT